MGRPGTSPPGRRVQGKTLHDLRISVRDLNGPTAPAPRQRPPGRFGATVVLFGELHTKKHARLCLQHTSVRLRKILGREVSLPSGVIEAVPTTDSQESQTDLAVGYTLEQMMLDGQRRNQRIMS